MSYVNIIIVANCQWYFKDISQPYFKEIHDIVYIFVIEKMWLFLKSMRPYTFLSPFVLGKLFCTGFLINL